jgi:hypothetical protein
MAASIVIRNIGATAALSVTASSTAAVTIAAAAGEIQAFASFLNTGAAAVAVNISPSGTAGAAVLPVAGTPQTVIMLPAAMTMPVIYAVPASFSCTAIGTAAGPSLVYITPVGAQS